MPITVPGPFICEDGDVTLGGRLRAADDTVVTALPSPGANVTLFGDVRTLTDHALGGDDTIADAGLRFQAVVGDAVNISGHAQGGDDQIQTEQLAVGDAVDITGHGSGGNDTVSAPFGIGEVALGDAVSMSDQARGGDDVVRGNQAIGDADVMSGHALGGNDTLTAAGPAGGFAVGDANQMEDHAVGGNDMVSSQGGIMGAQGAAIGDALIMTGNVQGGDDTVDAGVAYGDAETLSGSARGGDDLVIGAGGGLGGSRIYGDGLELDGHARGGNDTLVAPTSPAITGTPHQLWGDAAIVAPGATTGDDLFVFESLRGGHDQIMDFEPGKDHIELQGLGFAAFADLASHLQTTADGVLISFDAADDILVRGVTQLNASDFLFA